MQETPKPSNPSGGPESSIVDFSYVMELAGDKPDYIRQVLSIFLENTPPGLKELERLVHSDWNWEKVSKQAHFLKSSVGIVRVRDMHDKLQMIELLGKEKRDRDTITRLLDEIVETFAAAESVIRAKMEAA